MNCKNCGQELGENVKICPICGETQPLESVNQLKEHTIRQETIQRQVSTTLSNQEHYDYDGEGVEEDCERQKSRLTSIRKNSPTNV